MGLEFSDENGKNPNPAVPQPGPGPAEGEAGVPADLPGASGASAGQEKPQSEAGSVQSAAASESPEQGGPGSGEEPSSAEPPKKAFRVEIADDALLPEAETAEETAPPAGTPDGQEKAEPENEGEAEDIPARRRPSRGKRRAGKWVRRGGCLKTAVYLAVVLCLSVAIALFVISGVNDMFAFSKQNKSIEVLIPKGSGVAKVAAILKRDEVIQNGLVFRIYCHFSHVSGLKQGTFVLNSDMSYDEIVAALSDSSNNTSTAVVTVPEGFTAQKTAALLEEKHVCSASDFLAALNASGYTGTFLNSLPSGASSTRPYRLEGYCFPDTYSFYLKDSAKTVVQKMLDDFAARYTSSLSEKVKTSGMTLDQVLVLASVIQKESYTAADMKKVSSVFHNRLEKGTGSLQYLQSDATVVYANSVLRAAGATVAATYNTYKVKGLPAGPICNPGLDAVKAALSPAKTDYYYFVTDKNNKYYYASTFAKHEANVKKAAATGAAKGVDTKK